MSGWLWYDVVMLSRRVFLKQIATVSALFATTAKLYSKETPVQTKLTTLKVAGLQYAECANRHFVPKEPLRLQREADNLYDKYAVAVYRGEKKVGYIPKANSRIIASLIDSGVSLNAEVRYFHMEKEPWERLWVSVFKVG